MDDGRAASDAVMASSGAHQAWVIRNSEPRTSSRPREVPFLFASFSLGTQRERRRTTQKKFIRRIEGTSCGSEDGFCESTLEKEGTAARNF